jgi:hypothetical protein
MVAANRTDHGVDNLQQLIERYHLGGVIYFAWSNNVNNPQRIAGLSNGVQEVATGSGAELPALVSTDQEGGIVARVLEPATQFPGNMALGAARDPALAKHCRGDHRPPNPAHGSTNLSGTSPTSSEPMPAARATASGSGAQRSRPNSRSRRGRSSIQGSKESR